MTLVARRSFTAAYDGEEIAIHRGTTYIADDHELAARYPLRFEPAGPTDEELRSRLALLMRSRAARNGDA